MNIHTDNMPRSNAVLTASDIIGLLQTSDLTITRRRDLISSIRRVCTMGSGSPNHFVMTPASVRSLLAGINPAAHGVTAKSFANIRSNLGAALSLAGITDALPRRCAGRSQVWALIAEAVKQDKSLEYGLGRFINFCAFNEIAPDAVDDDVIRRFHHWLDTRSIEPDPDGKTRMVVRLWNKAVETVDGWPVCSLTACTLGLKPTKISWTDLPDGFRRDAESYLQSRQSPDPFDERPDSPTRALAKSTLHQQREHIRLAFDTLLNAGDAPASLSGLVEPERVKTAFRHYHDKAGGKANAFVVNLGNTLFAIARYHVRAAPEELARLKQIAAKLPSVAFDLTAKNKNLIRRFDDKQILGRLLALPDCLMGKARNKLDQAQRNFCLPAQVAIAIAILIAAPMRAQNLTALNWTEHFRQPGGNKGPLSILIPASQTKTRRSDLSHELDQETSDLLRWYRQAILPALSADPNGDLFVLQGGRRRSQSGLSSEITKTIKIHVGVHMTPHQFRHLAAALYLDARPEDFETVRQMLGHSYGKTTLIYAGLSSERASKAYGSIIAAERERLRTLSPKPRKRSRPRSKTPKT